MIPEIINNQIKKYNRQELEIFNNLFFKNSFFENDLSKDGLYKQYFDPNKHSFPSITKDIISKIVEKKLNCDLEDIHKNINENYLTIIEDGLTTKLQYIFYEYVDKLRDEYIGFLKNTIRPIIKKDFYFQQNPTFRIFFPNPNWSLFSKPFYHTDLFLGHPLEMINIWVPITNCFDSNSISYTDLLTSREFYKKSNCDFYEFYKNYYDQNSNFYEDLKSNLQTFNAEYGEFMFFDSKCLHGTSENISNITRISIDFRIIPVEEFSKFQINYRGTGRKKMEMKPGEYYGLKTIDKL